MSRLSARLARIERARPPVERPDLAGEAAQYGRPTGINQWSRTYESGSKDGGDLVSTLIAGTVVYQIHHVRLRDLV